MILLGAAVLLGNSGDLVGQFLRKILILYGDEKCNRLAVIRSKFAA